MWIYGIAVPNHFLNLFSVISMFCKCGFVIPQYATRYFQILPLFFVILLLLYFRTLHHFSPTAHRHASFSAIIYFQESVLSQLNQQSNAIL